MFILDQKSILSGFNKSKVIESISLLPQQIARGWESGSMVRSQRSLRRCRSIVVCGMGGSNLASELVTSVYRDSLSVPVLLVRDYTLPKFIGRDTLIIISSYSGSTVETLACLREARERRAQIIVITGGGALLKQAQTLRIPTVKLNVSDNPSKQPRYGVGVQLGALLAVLQQLQYLTININSLFETLNWLYDLNNQELSADVPQSKNSAKQVAEFLALKMPLVIGADILSANAHILSNQLNESAKSYATYHLLPEMNHHLLEGLAIPTNISQNMCAIFLQSSLFSPEISNRYKVTQKVFDRQKINYLTYSISGADPLAASLELLLWGSWVSFYLSVLHKQQPAHIPWVDYFKRELAKMK
jgi:glucose/mannose-6-phosphate isomerase